MYLGCCEQANMREQSGDPMTMGLGVCFSKASPPMPGRPPPAPRSPRRGRSRLPEPSGNPKEGAAPNFFSSRTEQKLKKQCVAPIQHTQRICVKPSHQSYSAALLSNPPEQSFPSILLCSPPPISPTQRFSSAVLLTSPP